jgi:hypothetical protein
VDGSYLKPCCVQINELDLNTGALDPEVRFIQKIRVNIPFVEKKSSNMDCFNGLNDDGSPIFVQQYLARLRVILQKEL